MSFIKILLAIFIIVHCNIGFAKTDGYKYEIIRENNHVIHFVTIDPKQYEIKIVKAHDSTIGRETVLQMAKRSKADLAINGGYFAMGENRDGKPTGALIAQGTVHAIKNINLPLVLIKDNVLSIQRANPQTWLKNAQTNRFTLSLVSGIPLLISNGRINQNILNKTSNFYTAAHARTALGITNNNMIIIIVVEHPYKRDLLSITIGEVQSFLIDNRQTISTKYNKPYGDITITELNEMFKQKLTISNGVQGITILELAEFMKNKGCCTAINLDGGGSSTLVIDHKVTNQTFGDKDEGNGEKIVRTVSDAIIFKKK